VNGGALSPTSPLRRFELHRGGASEQIAHEIRRYIVSEGLRPGDRLGTELELAGQDSAERYRSQSATKRAWWREGGCGTCVSSQRTTSLERFVNACMLPTPLQK
jgi:hypothetical protein